MQLEPSKIKVEDERQSVDAKKRSNQKTELSNYSKLNDSTTRLS